MMANTPIKYLPSWSRLVRFIVIPHGLVRNMLHERLCARMNNEQDKIKSYNYLDLIWDV